MTVKQVEPTQTPGKIMTCIHNIENSVTANFHYLEDRGEYVLELEARCVSCGEPVRFLGLPNLISTQKPCVNIDSTVLSIPIQYNSAPMPTSISVEFAGKTEH